MQRKIEVSDIPVRRTSREDERPGSPADASDASGRTPADDPTTTPAADGAAAQPAAPADTPPTAPVAVAARGHVVESVDRALRLLTSLGSAGPRGVVDLSREIGVAPSTTHRLLSTLATRGYAVQLADRRYDAGPALLAPGASRSGGSVAEVVRPFLEQLHAACGETCHVQVLRADEAMFVDGIESEQGLRVSSRTGMTMPAWTTSGGKAMLAELDPKQAESLVLAGREELTPAAAKQLSATVHQEIAEVRRTGYGVNENESERGVTAIGVSLGLIAGQHVALTVSLPSVRVTPAILRRLTATALGVASRARAALSRPGI